MGVGVGGWELTAEGKLSQQVKLELGLRIVINNNDIRY